MSGWVKFHRQLIEHWIFSFDNPDKALAWIFLFVNANHAPAEIMIKGRLKKVGRGQLAMSQLTLQKQFKWSQNKLKRFLILLKNERMIDYETDDLTTLITICNYDSFQGEEEVSGRPHERTDGRPHERYADDQSNDKQECNKNKNDKNVNNLLPDSGESENQSKISPIAKTAKPKKTRLSKDAELTDQFKQSAVAYWQSKNRTDLDPLEEYGKFKNHHVANGTTSACWKSSWSTWYTNAIKFNPVRLNHGNRQPANQQNDHIDWHSPFLDEDAIAEAERLMQRRGGQPVY